MLNPQAVPSNALSGKDPTIAQVLEVRAILNVGPNPGNLSSALPFELVYDIMERADYRPVVRAKRGPGEVVIESIYSPAHAYRVARLALVTDPLPRETPRGAPAPQPRKVTFEIEGHTSNQLPGRYVHEEILPDADIVGVW